MFAKQSTLNGAVRLFLAKCGVTPHTFYNTKYKNGSCRVKSYSAGANFVKQAQKVFGSILTKPAFATPTSHGWPSLVLVFRDMTQQTIDLAMRFATAMRKQPTKNAKKAPLVPRFLLTQTSHGSYRLKDRTPFIGEQLDRSTILHINKAINRRLL